MPTNEKEINNALFDQLTILERVRDALETGGEEAAKKELAKIEKEVNRKLYQKPPLTSE